MRERRLAEGILVALAVGMLAGCLVTAAVLTVATVRRSGPEQLRMEDS